MLQLTGVSRVASVISVTHLTLDALIFWSTPSACLTNSSEGMIAVVESTFPAISAFSIGLGLEDCRIAIADFTQESDI